MDLANINGNICASFLGTLNSTAFVWQPNCTLFVWEACKADASSVLLVHYLLVPSLLREIKCHWSPPLLLTLGHKHLSPIHLSKILRFPTAAQLIACLFIRVLSYFSPPK